MPKAVSKHIIHKLSVEFNINGKEESAPIKDKSLAFVKETILPAIEQVMDELEDGRLIRIDQLDLQLDNVDPKQIKQELLKKIRETFPERIQAAVQKKASVKNARSVLDTLEHFLSSGLLPWWDHAHQLADIEKTILQDLQKDQLDKSRLQNILINSNRERIILQLSDHFFQSIFKVFLESEEIWKILPELQKLFSDQFYSRRIRKYFLHATLEQFTNYPKQTSVEDKIIISVLHQLQKDSDKALQASLNHYKNAKFEIIGDQVMQKWHQQKIEQTKQPAKQHQLPEDSSDPVEELYIQNAGLILLHPFFVYLFEELEYTKEKQFIDPFHQQQAALALEYLLASKENYPEHQLALNKILCGIPLTTPIESNLILSDKLREQSEQLLQATIKHWDALKNTSTDGLRHNFLLREGKLTRKADGDWKLFVEYKTHDILLSNLNWNYSLVKLPWMTNILWVEWG